MTAIGAALLLALGFHVSTASAEPLSMAFTESRANVGVQLSDAALLEPPETAPLAAQIDPGSGSIAAGVLQVPDFSTFITDPVEAEVIVDFEIGTITGSFVSAIGALTLSGEAGGTLTADGKECIVSTTPAVLSLTAAGNNGGEAPRYGQPFAAGLGGPGAIAGQWTDMHATPVDPNPGGDTAVCKTVDERIGGPGGIWLYQEGAVAPDAGGGDGIPPKTDGGPPPPFACIVPRLAGMTLARARRQVVEPVPGRHARQRQGPPQAAPETEARQPRLTLSLILENTVSLP